MSLLNVGYKFNKSTKAWLAAFILAASPAALTNADTSKDTGHHYELFSAAQLIEHEQEALQDGETESYAALHLAREAIEETTEGLRATPNDLPDELEDNLYAEHGDEHELYKVVDPMDFDWTEFSLAQKTALVQAEFVEEGTQVETILANGHVETTNTAGEDGGYRITNPDGEQYLMKVAEFEKRYDETETAGIYAPKADPRKVLEIDQNIVFHKASWNEDMWMKDGSKLVYQGPDNIYGIGKEEYENTYSALIPKPPLPV